MKKRLLYLLSAVAAMLTSCSDEVVEKVDFLNGNEKTPITVVSNISANTPVTRAADAKWEANDMLFAYVQHVKENTSTPPTSYDVVNVTGTEPRIQYFKVNTTTDNSVDNFTNVTNPTLSPVDASGNAAGFYWDDFSVGAKGDATDIRTENPQHYLQSYYGYCYNGGTPSIALGADVTHQTEYGIIEWTVAANQSTSNTTDTKAFQHSDLLFSPTQTPVAYDHGSNNTINGREKVLSIPFTHAMSKVTVEIECKEGFDANVDNFANTVVKLQGMNTTATVTAPTATLSSFGTPAEITTIGTAHETTPNIKKSFSALIAPTVFSADKLFAKIEGVDNNDYEIKLTDATIDAKDPENNTKLNAWSTQLAAAKVNDAAATTVTPDAAKGYNATDGGLTKPGVHYMITVTISKQQIKVKATIQEWNAVSAEGIGQILFDNDINETGDIAEGLRANGFDLYKSTTTEFGPKATTVSWNTTDSKWEYSPNIYWQSSSDKEYFRALSGAVNDDASTTTVNESLAMTQGRDVLWGTTPTHSGTDVNGNAYNYKKSNPIDPRTGDVPLDFEHAMTKISVNLKSSDTNPVVLDAAKIDIINTYNEGKIDLNTGEIGNLDLTLTSPNIYTLSETVNSEFKLLDQVVIPQSLTADKNGATREATPTFYQSGELTKIYSDETSLPEGGGEGTYYLTSTLDPVNYAESELTAIYADGTSISDGGSSETYVTSTLDQVAAQDAIKYTEEEAAKENAKHLIKDSQNRVPGDDGYETTYEDGYTPVTTDTDRVPAIPAHYKINANSKKATTSTLKCYKTKDGSEQHNPGELKSAGNKIMMYITLADNTRYSIELSKCKDSTDTLIQEWERGKHYTYTITLGKEEIIFRALIKDWDEKTGTGNATLDWD